MYFGKRRKSKKQDFNPSHIVVSDAIDLFLKKGGRITTIDLKAGYLNFMAGQNEVTADEFLMGQ